MMYPGEIQKNGTSVYHCTCRVVQATAIEITLNSSNVDIFSIVIEETITKIANILLFNAKVFNWINLLSSKHQNI